MIFFERIRILGLLILVLSSISLFLFWRKDQKIIKYEQCIKTSIEKISEEIKSNECKSGTLFGYETGFGRPDNCSFSCELPKLYIIFPDYPTHIEINQDNYRNPKFLNKDYKYNTS